MCLLCSGDDDESKPSGSKLAEIPPSPTTISQQQIFDYIINEHDFVAASTAFLYNSTIADFADDITNQNNSENSNKNNRFTMFNRFGQSEKDDLYDVADDEDALIGAGRASFKAPMRGGFGVSDGDESGSDDEVNLEDFEFRPRTK